MTFNVPSKSLLNVRGMKGRVSNGRDSNLGTRGKDFQKLIFSKKLSSPKVKVFSKKKVFTSISSLISLFCFRNQGVLKKKGLHLELISLFSNFCPDFSRFRAIFEVKTIFFREHLDFGNKTGKSEMIPKRKPFF